MSVWVEILYHLCTKMRSERHAPRERVSWNALARIYFPNASCHAPRERVSWNINVVICQREITSHAPRERVSWNVEERSRINLAGVTLHVSVWVEICLSEVRITLSLSRSTWACELKFAETCQASIESRHAPRERVSWNKEPEKPDCYPKGVTLHVSVWVEIFIDFYSNFFALRHAPRERVSWNAHTSAQIILLCGHAPRERVSWNTKEIL